MSRPGMLVKTLLSEFSSRFEALNTIMKWEGTTLSLSQRSRLESYIVSSHDFLCKSRRSPSDRVTPMTQFLLTLDVPDKGSTVVSVSRSGVLWSM